MANKTVVLYRYGKIGEKRKFQKSAESRLRRLSAGSYCISWYEGKGRKLRTIYLSDDALDALVAYLNTRKDRVPALFLSARRTRISRRTVQRIIDGVARAAGDRIRMQVQERLTTQIAETIESTIQPRAWEWSLKPDTCA